MIIKISKNLKVKENIVKQLKNSIKTPNKKIIEMQNPFICLFNIFYIIFDIAVKSVAAAI